MLLIYNYKIELSFLSQGKDKAEKPSERSWWDGTETQSSERRFLFAHQPAGAQHNVPEAPHSSSEWGGNGEEVCS